MGWTIGRGDFLASYGGMYDIADEIETALDWTDWQTVRHLFRRGSGDPFTVNPAEAGRIAAVLARAAASGRMTAAWAPARVQALADSARRAASANRPWTWE